MADNTPTLVGHRGCAAHAPENTLGGFASAAEMGCDLLTATDRLQPAGAIYLAMDEADVQRILSHPHAMIGSDGLPHDEHPRRVRRAQYGPRPQRQMRCAEFAGRHL